jgi:hypothetical protein
MKHCIDAFASEKASIKYLKEEFMASIMKTIPNQVILSH